LFEAENDQAKLAAFRKHLAVIVTYVQMAIMEGSGWQKK